MARMTPEEDASLQRLREALHAHFDVLRAIAAKPSIKREIGSGEQNAQDWIYGHAYCQFGEIYREWKLR